MTRSWLTSSSAWLSTGVPVSARRSPSGHDGLGQPAHRLRALGVRVLAVVRLVDDERARRAPGERLAVRGDDLVVEDRDVGARRHGRPGPSTTATLRCGSQRARLALPVELERRRADDDGGIGVVGLERGERLDRLAEALLVGQERAARVQRVADAGPLERLERAAERAGDLGDRLGRSSRASGGSRRRASACSARRRSSARPRAGLDLDAVQGQEVVERLDEPRVERQRARPARRSGRRSNAAPASGSQSTSRRRRSPSTSLGQRAASPARGSSPRTQRGDAAAGARRRGAPSAAPPAPRRPPASSGTSSAPSSLLHRAVEQRSGSVPGARVQHEPAAAVVARRRRRGRSSGARSRQPRVDLGARRAARGSGARTSATWTPAQSSTGAHHSRRSQSKRRPGILRTAATICAS